MPGKWKSAGNSSGISNSHSDGVQELAPLSHEEANQIERRLRVAPLRRQMRQRGEAHALSGSTQREASCAWLGRSQVIRWPSPIPTKTSVGFLSNSRTVTLKLPWKTKLQGTSSAWTGTSGRRGRPMSLGKVGSPAGVEEAELPGPHRTEQARKCVTACLGGPEGFSSTSKLLRGFRSSSRQKLTIEKSSHMVS